MRTSIKTIIFGFALTLAACDGGEKANNDKGGEAKTAAKADGGDKAAAEAGDQAAAGEEVAAAEEAVALDPKVEKAVTVANKIAADPSSADDILAEAGMDREGFEELLYEIARDPELSKSYAVARET
ncbi:hypothetical protein G6O69_34960 [Pseudenhygromyxa sp. WMMC2535]|uniref:hypothetical protein n=1 Tax=Pseudenhygromyxa sp. WMMC2535 TaxID=2712867 RepID=UPI001557E92B|nr:hypothetical protein [Pseudenhygromyxa sp. WMMC2535]NVB43076.1 hypothetical protein [Pseudenhygromyxa sp. WMMC2535]